MRPNSSQSYSKRIHCDMSAEHGLFIIKILYTFPWRAMQSISAFIESIKETRPPYHPVAAILETSWASPPSSPDLYERPYAIFGDLIMVMVVYLEPVSWKFFSTFWLAIKNFVVLFLRRKLCIEIKGLFWRLFQGNLEKSLGPCYRRVMCVRRYVQRSMSKFIIVHDCVKSHLPYPLGGAWVQCAFVCSVFFLWMVIEYVLSFHSLFIIIHCCSLFLLDCLLGRAGRSVRSDPPQDYVRLIKNKKRKHKEHHHTLLLKTLLHSNPRTIKHERQWSL